ncbi:hypothetical protein LEP1GSC052_2720 [Leptospira kmetyi serovar Malaysia str. Bejo-Iso9]|nr:hypothetical protein LEP1GSC052_2720 [Leptospira kmetyi serovar Malaysia str. Bejo-Iso9]
MPSPQKTKFLKSATNRNASSKEYETKKVTVVVIMVATVISIRKKNLHHDQRARGALDL